MDDQARSGGHRDAKPSPGPAATAGRAGGLRRVRLDRTLGFWLGGAVLGTAGCFLGATMPYRHPVAVTANVLWWGLFLGCLGASVGALLGLGAEQAGPSQASTRLPGANRRPVGRRVPCRFSREGRRRF
jgi:hypothetical protein